MPDSIDNERFRRLLLSLPGKALEFLYNAYYQNLLRISKTFTRNAEVSKDIVQETFVYVWERRKWLSQHHDKSIQYYLMRVVKNKSISYYKRNLRDEARMRYLNGNPQLLIEHSIETHIIDLEIQKEIRDVIATFPPRERECLMMKIDKGMSTDQIAENLNVSRKAVERSLTSANKRLRGYWSPEKERAVGDIE